MLGPVVTQGVVSAGANHWICSYCHATFKARKSVVVHIKTIHLKVKDFACQYCSKQFGVKSNMKAHEKKCVDKAKSQ